MFIKLPSRRTTSGMTLVEMMVAVGLGMILLAIVCSLLVSGSRSLAAVANYAALEYQSRQALDQITVSVRGAQAVRQTSNTNSCQLVTADGVRKFEYDATRKTLTMILENGDMKPLLANCSPFTFRYWKRPAAGQDWNNLDPWDITNAIKVVQVEWTCSRQLVGSLLNTEVMQSTRIVVRHN